MSHLRYCQLKITNPNVAILKKAMEFLAAHHGFQVTDEVIDYYGNKTKVLTAVKIGPNRAYGVQVKNNQIQVVGDDYNMSYQLKTFEQEVNQAYRAVVYQQALRSQGYSTKMTFKGNKIQLVAEA